MSREEAIEKLELMRQKVDEETYRALILAIKALEQEPTDENLHREREQAYMQGYEDASKRFRQQPCDDAVSRQAVLSKKIYTETEEGWSGYTVDADYIEHLPSVTQKSGKWIEHEIEDTLRWVTCSECNCEMHKKFNYCPNCGAKMVEPQESGDKE